MASQRRPRTLLEQGLVPQGSKEGACIALGMIWMRSMERRVFEMMALDAFLDPEDAMLRVWMRCLIMWDCELHVWLEMSQLSGNSDGRNPLTETGCVDALVQMNELGRSLGVHLALACKLAGSRDEVARDFVLEQVDRMLAIKLCTTDAAVKEVVEMAICFSVLSAAVVMTGSRDLRTFAYVRALMNCSGLYCGSMWYEVLGLAAGLLFLGMDGCHPRWSFGGSAKDLAYLIIALYPSSSSEKYWSYCRNLWVLSGGVPGEPDARVGNNPNDGGDDAAMTMESVLLRIRSCGSTCDEAELQELLDVFLSSQGDEQVATAIVNSLVSRISVPS